MRLFISALTMEEAEFMLKILDKWLRAYYNTDGVHRRTSFNRRANLGIRAQIVCEVDREMWDYVHEGATWEMVRRMGKAISTEVYHFGKNVEVDFCTEEAEL